MDGNEDHRNNEYQLSEAEQDGRETVAAASGWGISLALHAIVLLLLALVVVAGRMVNDPVPTRTVVVEVPPPPETPPEDVDFDEVPVEIRVEVTDQEPIVHDMEIEVEEIESTEDPEAEVNEAKGREEAVAAQEAGGSSAFLITGAGASAAGAMGHRRGGGRHKALRDGGGTPASEQSVRLGLRWFARHQSINGMWDVDAYQLNCEVAGPKCEPGTDRTGADGDAASTGYAVLAFLGAGYDHRTPNQFRRVVADGVNWLVAAQKADGSFGASRNYENGVCTMALAEAFAMTGDPNLREPAQRAVDYLLSVQNGQGNGYGGLGWDYTKAKSRNDASVSGWPIMALKSAQAGGLDIGQGMEGARHYFDQAWNATNNQGADISDRYEDRSGFPYTWDSASGATKRHDRSAIGLCIGVFLGKGQDDLMMETLANDVMARALDEKDADYQINSWPVNTYYLYYNTLGMFQVGGPRWEQWNPIARDLLVDNQRRDDDCFNGSWDYQGTRFHGHKIGRLVSTAYAVMSLEVYYRYDRIAKQNKQQWQ